MSKSIYAEYMERLLPSFTDIREKINGKKTPLTYLHKQMLRRVHSTNKRWESASVNTRYVAADVVALDSPLPIKSRPAIAFADGKLPKIGLMRQMKESDIDELDTLIERHASLAEILRRLYNDVDFCSVGIDEKNEYHFLYGFSRGYVLSEDLNNTGAGIRVNYGYLQKNTFGVIKKDHISREDIERVLSQADADGNVPGFISLSAATYRKLRAERWARELVANARAMTYTDSTALPIPSKQAFDDAFADEFNGIKFNVIDRQVSIEKNGKAVPQKPFANDRLIFHTSMEVGALVWGDLAEKNHPLDDVTYQLIDEFKLISNYGTPTPLQVFTTGQALVLPVIENVDEIYVIDATVAQPIDDSDKESGATDSVITIFGHRYDKSDVIAKANAQGLSLTLSMTDTEVIEAINGLNQKKQGLLKKALETECVYYPELSVSSMAFEKAGATKTSVVTTNASGAVTASSEAAWLTVTVSEKTVSVVAAANSESEAPAREATVVVTAGSKTATIAVSQEKA